MTTKQMDELLEDLDVAATDLEFIVAALTELREYVARGHVDPTDRVEIGAEVLPRIAAVRSVFVEQVTA